MNKLYNMHHTIKRPFTCWTYLAFALEKGSLLSDGSRNRFYSGLYEIIYVWYEDNVNGFGYEWGELVNEK